MRFHKFAFKVALMSDKTPFTITRAKKVIETVYAHDGIGKNTHAELYIHPDVFGYNKLECDGVVFVTYTEQTAEKIKRFLDETTEEIYLVEQNDEWVEP